MPDLLQQLHVLTQQNDIRWAIAEAIEKRKRLNAESDQIEARITSLVAAGRESGITWHQLGQVLGVSRQAAWERYGKTDPDPIRSLPPSADE